MTPGAGCATHADIAQSGNETPLTAAGAGALRLRLRSHAFETPILIVFLIYAALFIYQTSFVIEGVRYFCLFDDEMISMRYAANFANHLGLVWNPGGERVLGFTNLLWVLYMSLFHLLPVPAAKLPLLIQASGVVFLLVSILFTGRIASELFPQRRHVAALSMILVGFYGPLVNWSLQGTEVSLLTLFVTASCLLALRSLSSNTTSVKLYFLLGLATLCRLDMAVFACSVLLSLTIVQPREWKSHLLIGGLVILAFLAAQGVFNSLYYGDVLPNTYYLKMSGYPLIPRVERGLRVAMDFMLPLLPLVLGLALATPVTGRFAGTTVLMTAILGQIAYSIWVGGDAWEWWGGANRYVAIVMPLFFILVAFTLTQYLLLIERWFNSRSSLLEGLSLTLLLCTALLLSNVSNLKSNFLLAKPMQTSDPQEWGTNEQMVRQALLIRSLTDEGARIAVVWAGSLPYFSDRYAIDLLGKNDSRVAHEKMHSESETARQNRFWPGHLKWDYAYSIGELKPDIVVQLWEVDDTLTSPSFWLNYVPVRVQGFDWYVRRDSRHLRNPTDKRSGASHDSEAARFPGNWRFSGASFGLLVLS